MGSEPKKTERPWALSSSQRALCLDDDTSHFGEKMLSPRMKGFADVGFVALSLLSSLNVTHFYLSKETNSLLTMWEAAEGCLPSASPQPLQEITPQLGLCVCGICLPSPKPQYFHQTQGLAHQSRSVSPLSGLRIHSICSLELRAALSPRDACRPACSSFLPESQLCFW